MFIGGGFDLSVAAVAGFAAIISGKIFLQTGVGVWASLILGALVGLGCGFGNGLLITLGRVNAFMATLATSTFTHGPGGPWEPRLRGGFTLGLGSMGDQPRLRLAPLPASAALPRGRHSAARLRGRRKPGGAWRPHQRVRATTFGSYRGASGSSPG